MQLSQTMKIQEKVIEKKFKKEITYKKISLEYARKVNNDSNILCSY